MRFSTLLSAITMALATATAAPIADAEAAPSLEKRQSLEVVYLSVCYTYTLYSRDDNQGRFLSWDREYDYYENTNNSQNGEVPSSNNRAPFNDNIFNQSNRPNFVGNNPSKTFGSGVSFHSSIYMHAYGVATGSVAGSGQNGYHDWVCRKDIDGGRQLYQTTTWTANNIGSRRTCLAEFYCMHDGY
ncbi:hypothetical protein BJ508DRAFT_303344 [Ascobolus immersus RN42]|uniref:Uncharacterized protein n=1 Tax=Ascobolus immersus RN42 TaxID=1160509 RepID=A0A3N4IFM1_ASCIM|nr:hypothetical protein BJ508DRAFT_303344 [Ascobolus immersus RN42]